MFRYNRIAQFQPSSTEAGFTLAEKMVLVAILSIGAALSAPSMLAAFNRAQVKQTMADVRSALSETQREAIKGNKICTLTLNFVDGKVTGSCLTTGDRTLDTNVDIVTNLTDPNSTASLDDKSNPVLVGSDVQPPLGLNDGEHISQIAMASATERNTKVAKAGIVVQVIAKCKGNTNKGLGLGTCKNESSSSSSSTSSSSTSIPIQYGVLGNPEFAIVSANETPADPTGKIVFFDANNTQGNKRCIAISNTLGLTRIGTYQGETQPTAITDSGRCTAENWEKQ